MVEERILARASDKRSMNELVVEAGQFNKASTEAADRQSIMEELMREYNNECNSSSSSSSSSVIIMSVIAVLGRGPGFCIPEEATLLLA